MKKQAEMLKCMNPKERQTFAVGRLQAFFRILKSEGFSMEELSQAAMTTGAGYSIHHRGKEKTAQFLAMLALRVDDPAADPLPMPEADKDGVVH